MKKKCRECGGMYETEDKEIKLRINHKDIEALENAIWCDLTTKQFNKIKGRVNKVWKQICDGEDKWD